MKTDKSDSVVPANIRDEEPNEETATAIENSRHGVDQVICNDANDFFKKLHN
jgi:antitoxin component of RelBE/YafQ-DinJ toxin-antitoxin module